MRVFATLPTKLGLFTLIADEQILAEFVDAGASLGVAQSLARA